MLAFQRTVDGRVATFLLAFFLYLKKKRILDALRLEASPRLLLDLGDTPGSLKAISWLSLKEPLRWTNVLFTA
jgi:hypothetical protein